MTLARDVAETAEKGNWFDALALPFVDLLGEPVLALFVLGTTTTLLFSWSRDKTLTSVWVVLVSGFFVPMLPAPVAALFVLIMTIGLAGAAYSVHSSKLR